jgi:hypothetical protein
VSGAEGAAPLVARIEQLEQELAVLRQTVNLLVQELGLGPSHPAS